jgi:hypothetical protein
MGATFKSILRRVRFFCSVPLWQAVALFGLGILEVDSEQEARNFGEGDPSVRAGMNKFEIHPMRVSAARAKTA